MNRSERQIRETTVIATTVTVVVLIFSVIAELVGFSKTDPGATPKKFIDVIAHWPRYLGIGIVFFIGTFWWQSSQNEPPYLICRKCKETTEKGKESSALCTKCGGELEDLEGFYERHPELRQE
jgi:uncharacterized membrane protein YvbJ